MISVPASLTAYVVVSNSGLFHVATNSTLPVCDALISVIVVPFNFQPVNVYPSFVGLTREVPFPSS